MPSYHELSGKIEEVFEIERFSNGFIKRRMWVTEQVDRDRKPNTWELEFWKEEGVKIPDSYAIGDYITCYYDQMGTKFKKTDGTIAIKGTLKCWNIKKDGLFFRPM